MRHTYIIKKGAFTARKIAQRLKVSRKSAYQDTGQIFLFQNLLFSQDKQKMYGIDPAMNQRFEMSSDGMGMSPAGMGMSAVGMGMSQGGMGMGPGGMGMSPGIQLGAAYNMFAMNGGFNDMAVNSYNPRRFSFAGNAISLLSRLQSMTDQQINMYNDARIIVTGTEIQPLNVTAQTCTIIWGSILILPLFCLCLDVYKRCVYPAFEIQMNVYQGLGRLLSGHSLKNITLQIVDNLFDASKAKLICQILARSRINGFTFLNLAGNWDYYHNQYSNFIQHMRPIKQMPNISSDIRWANQIVR